MTRRRFLLAAAASALPLRAGAVPVVLPVHHMLDRKAQCRAGDVRHFWDRIWPQAAGDIERCGMRIQLTSADGEVERPPSRTPVIHGLRPGCLNMVLTHRVPIQWDQGRGLAGVTTLYRGYHMIMIAIARAHGHRIPFVATNTCTHEMLHALLLDMFENRPPGWRGQARETRIDAVATRLWFRLGDGDVGMSAREYVRRLGHANSSFSDSIL